MNLARESRSVGRKRDFTRIPDGISMPCGGRASVTRFLSVGARGKLLPARPARSLARRPAAQTRRPHGTEPQGAARGEPRPPAAAPDRRSPAVPPLEQLLFGGGGGASPLTLGCLAWHRAGSEGPEELHATSPVHRLPPRTVDPPQGHPSNSCCSGVGVGRRRRPPPPYHPGPQARHPGRRRGTLAHGRRRAASCPVAEASATALGQWGRRRSRLRTAPPAYAPGLPERMTPRPGAATSAVGRRSAGRGRRRAGPGRRA